MQVETSPVTASEIAGLCTAYRDALDSIEREPDRIELEIGRAAHRLEATQTYARLAAHGVLDDETLASFGEYVAGLSGSGALAERTVDALDASAKRGARGAMYLLAQSLLQMALVPAVSLVVGVAAGVWLSAQEFGAALVPVAVAAGLLPFVEWVGRGLRLGLDFGWSRSWAWATTLGQASDDALAVVRSLELDVWQRTGAFELPAPFTARARRRAKIVIGVGWLAVFLGIAAVVSGFLISLEGSDACIPQAGC